MTVQSKKFVEGKGLSQRQPDQLLNPQERERCEQLASGAAPHSQRAQALLALDQGTTQKEASRVAGLSQGQVRYWLGKFRQSGMAIFPEGTLVGAQPREAGSEKVVVSGGSGETAVGSTDAVEADPAKKKGKGKKGKAKKKDGKQGKKASSGKKSVKRKKKKKKT